MARTKKNYRKLPGTGHGFATVRKLYLADDHLLWLEQTSYSESYARFDLKDIQGITARETMRWSANLALSGYAFALFASLTIFLSSPNSRIVFAVIAGSMGLIFFYNLIRGRTCRATLYTAVSTKSLPSLHRLRTFHKVTTLLAPLIEERQGQFVPEQSQMAPPSDDTTASQSISIPVHPSPAEVDPANVYQGRILLWISLALLCEAATIGLLLWLHEPMLWALRFVAILAVSVLVMIGFANIPRTLAYRGQRRILWTNLVYLSIIYVLLYIGMMVGYIQSESDLVFGNYEAILPSNSPASFWAHVISLTICLTLAAIGVLTETSTRTKR